jgi:signal transduction histidine kinase
VLLASQAGDVIGEMSLLEATARNASGRARTDSVLLAIRHDQLNQLLNTSPSAARAMLFTITSRLRSTELMLRQSEKMAQLGTLTAGIAHELNNPAAAAQRGAEQLRDSLASLQSSLMQLNELDLTGPQKETVEGLDRLARERAAQPLELNALSRSDKESDVEACLETLEVDDGWEIAPDLVSLGFEPAGLEDLEEKFPAPQFQALIVWIHAVFSVYSLLEEISVGASQISSIVRSLKTYVYLDQAPMQEVDVHEGLDNTLVMLRSKLKSGIQVRREYAPDLPHIQAYGSELNQVWTNIIDNAIDAMQGQGEIICAPGGRRISLWKSGYRPRDSEDVGKIFILFLQAGGQRHGVGVEHLLQHHPKHGGEI